LKVVVSGITLMRLGVVPTIKGVTPVDPNEPPKDQQAILNMLVQP
jgi:hypothetical protein